MLNPDPNEPPTRSRTWMLVAASVAAVAVVGGLVIATGRDSDDNVPADQPVVTVPTTSGVDGSDAAVEGDVLPDVPLPTQGRITTTCSMEAGTTNEDGSQTSPQTCTATGDPLPVPQRDSRSFTGFPRPDQLAPANAWVTTSDDGYVAAGYSHDGGSRFISVQPGDGAFDGETVWSLGRTTVEGSLTDWSTDVDDAPLATTEEGGITADVTVTCTAEFVSGDDTEQIIDQDCVFDGDDARFVPPSEVIRVRTFPADLAATTLADGTLFFTGESASGSLIAGIGDGGTTVRAVGVRPGTGEFEGQLIHDVLHLTTASDGDVTGVIRSTVWPQG